MIILKKMENKISLYSEYPKIIGFPVKYKVVHNRKQLNDFIRENINKFGIHLSLYSFNKDANNINEIDYYMANVNKIFFDVDEGDWKTQMLRLKKWCIKNDIIHRHHFSSFNGGHFFIGCKPQIQYKKNAVRNFQKYIIKKLKLHIQDGISTIGDITRSFRITNTYNFKHNCWCVPATEDEILNIYKLDLKKITSKPRKINNNLWYGNKLVNLKNFDKKQLFYGKAEMDMTINKNKLLSHKEIEKLNIPFEKFPDCIKQLLNKPDLNYHGRYLLILYLRDQQYISLNGTEIVSILKDTLNREKWLHCSSNYRGTGANPGEQLKPVVKTLSSMHYKFPSCIDMKEANRCPSWSHCDRNWHPIFD